MLWVAIQPLIVESFVFALSAYRVRRSIQSNEPEVLDGDGRMAAELRSLTGYALLGWAEGQLDRVLLGAIAGTTALGSYSYSQALGRSGGGRAVHLARDARTDRRSEGGTGQPHSPAPEVSRDLQGAARQPEGSAQAGE